jgi:DNA-binding LacI/PurR family transcriptional regulator
MTVKKKKSRVTLKDLAKASGLSVPTVSQILNNKDNNYCSQQKREEVQRLAREMNYKPNIGYKIMTGGPTNIAAMIFSQLRGTRQYHILNLSMQITFGLEQRGYAVYSTVMGRNPDDNLAKIKELEDKGCRSFVFIGSAFGYLEITEYIKSCGYDYIALNQDRTDRFVNWDEEHVFVEYMNYFETRGITNYKLVTTRNRLEARMRVVLNEQDYSRCVGHFLEIPQNQNLDTETFQDVFEFGREVAKAEYRRNPELQGLIYTSDWEALGAAHFFNDLGMAVGKDILLCGMYNTEAVCFSTLPVTSAEFDLKEISGLLLNNLTSKGTVQIMINPKIIVREKKSGKQ